MTVNYTLTQDDLLNFQLFAASKSEIVKRQRSRALLINIALIIGMSSFIYWREKEIYTPVIIGALLISLLPLYLRSYYKRHIRKYVEAVGKSTLGTPAEFSYSDGKIFSSRGESSTQLSVAEVKNVYEIGEYFIVYLQSEQGYVIPKAQLTNITAFRELMKKLAAEAGVNFTEDLQWKWR